MSILKLIMQRTIPFSNLNLPVIATVTLKQKQTSNIKLHLIITSIVLLHVTITTTLVLTCCQNENQSAMWRCFLPSRIQQHILMSTHVRISINPPTTIKPPRRIKDSILHIISMIPQPQATITLYYNSQQYANQLINAQLPTIRSTKLFFFLLGTTTSQLHDNFSMIVITQHQHFLLQVDPDTHSKTH